MCQFYGANLILLLDCSCPRHLLSGCLLSEHFNRPSSSVLATNAASMCACVWVTFEDALSCGMDGGELEREPTECQHHITKPLSAAAHAATALAQASYKENENLFQTN